MMKYLSAFIDIALLSVVFIVLNLIAGKPTFPTVEQLAFSMGVLSLIKIYDLKDNK